MSSASSPGSADPFSLLHPALQHHIVNSLGWKSLRPLQEAAIEPILEGENVILLAPTAGGKTEAALFPLLSRILSEDRRGLTVLYLCPIKALLNNLEPRLRRLSELLGRRVGLWHGDIGPSKRRQILRDPPDLLLTTPESTEVMLTSTRTDHRVLFADLREIVVDEMHAFAGDDRGWHLLAVAERLARLAGRDLQRVGLSATIGNAEALLGWLAGSSRRPRRVVAPEAARSVPALSAATPPTEVKLDWVGNLENAGRLIEGLYRGEKRLVFCDSRARVEQLAAHLHRQGIRVFVSHSSLSLDERRRAEDAFAEERDAVIVATSTLELGIDVGDLDRVIQIDAPATVASYLQRLGRTGRRPGSVRNCLFLATRDDAFLQAAGLLQLWSEGYVEPVEPPAEPLHILAQQLMGLILQEGGVGRRTWRDWLAGMPGFATLDPDAVERTIAHMVETDILFEDAGILSMGIAGERSYGYRHFMEILTVFTSHPLFAVRFGHEELGWVHPITFALASRQRPVLLLAGRSWSVVHLVWRDRIAYVEPSAERGRSQWLGSGQALHFHLCRAIRRVLARGAVDVPLSRRGEQKLAELTVEHPWIDETGTTIVREPNGDLRWWTFAGLAANSALAAQLGNLRKGVRGQNLSIALEPETEPSQIETLIEKLRQTSEPAHLPIDREALKGLKFHACLPEDLAVRVLEARLADPDGVRACLQERVRLVNSR